MTEPQRYFFNRLVTKSLKVKDQDERTFSGILSCEMVDKQGEVMVIDELMKVLPIWLERGAPITDTHSNRVLGKGTGFRRLKIKAYDGSTYDAVEIDGYIFKHYELDRDIWEKMKSGEYKGLSFGGSTKSDRVPFVWKDGSLAYKLIDLEQYEVAVCKEPAVPLAIFTKINHFAKAISRTSKSLQYTKHGEDVCIRCDNVGCYVEKSEELDKVSVKPDPSEEDMTPGSLAISPTGKGMVEDHASEKCPYCGYIPSSGLQPLNEHLAQDHPDKLDSMGLQEVAKPEEREQESNSKKPSDSADLESVGLTPEDVNNQPVPGEEHQTHQGTSDDIGREDPQYERTGEDPQTENTHPNDPRQGEQPAGMAQPEVPIETEPEKVGDIMVETPVAEDKNTSGINHPEAGIQDNINNKVPGNQDPKLQDPRAEGEFQGQAEPQQTGFPDKQHGVDTSELEPKEDEGSAGVTGGSGVTGTNIGGEGRNTYDKYGVGYDTGRNEDQNRNDPSEFSNNVDTKETPGKKEARREETVDEEGKGKTKKVGDVGMRAFKSKETKSEVLDEEPDTRNINSTPTPMTATQNTQPPNSLGKASQIYILETELRLKSVIRKATSI